MNYLTRSLISLFLLSSLLHAETVVQSARDLPIVDQADVVVIGGTSAAVAAAVAAKTVGTDVLLLSPRIGLGDDIAGTRELYSQPVPEMLTHPIAKTVFSSSIAFNYTASVTPATAHPDPGNTVLKNGIAANAVSGSVEYGSDVALTLSFMSVGTLTSLDLYYYKRSSGDLIFDTTVVSLETSLDGSSWTTATIGTTTESVQSVGAGDALMVCHITPPTGTRIQKARLSLAIPNTAVRQLLDEIVIQTDENDSLAVIGANITPFSVKKQLGAALDGAGVRLLSAVVVTDILRDVHGNPSGVIIANRSGRQAITAKVIIDATENAIPARQAGAQKRPFIAGDYVFSRIVMADAEDAPTATGMSVAPIPDRSYITSIAGVTAPAGKQSVVTGTVFRCTFSQALTTGSMEEILEVEQHARDLTWTSTCIDQADRLVWLPPDPIVGVHQDLATTWTDAASLDLDAFRPSGVPFVYVLGSRADVSRAVAEKMLNPARAMAAADRVGAAAAADALNRPTLTLAGLSVPATTTAPATSLVVSERLTGFPSKGTVETLPQGAAEIPVIATCDVLVVGAGTAGAPAAIAAARAGANTVVVDILYSMGGVQTDGRIGRYWYGNERGFTTTDVEPGWKSKGSALYTAKSEWYRDAMRDAGARVLFGTLANGAIIEGTTLKGAVIVLPDGTRGVIRAHTVVDATGNSEIIQAAAAPVYFIDHAELAVQGAGWAKQSLGNSYQNTDIAFVNDMDPTDLTFFSRRVNASLPVSTWDIGRNPASRERHRVQGAFTVSPIDILNNRTYPDTIVVAKSDFDTHGFTTHDVFFIRDPGNKVTLFAHLPFRALLPETLDGVLVTGLGISAHRDAMPILRMQPDVQNQGYAAGYAAALAAQANVAVRNINIATLQSHLVAKNILTAAQAGNADSFPLSGATIANAVIALTNNYATLPIVLSDTTTALPLLEAALASAVGFTNQLIYANTLGLLGSPSAAPILASTLSAPAVWDTGWNYRGMGQAGRSVSTRDGYVISAGRTGSHDARAAILAKASLLLAGSEFSHHRAVSLALENFPSPSAISQLSSQLALVRGYSLASNANPPAITNYSDTFADTERNRCLKELTLARALYRIGDDPACNAEAVLTAYANDPRGLYATYARLVLAEGKAEVNQHGIWIAEAETALWETPSNWHQGDIPSVSADITNTLATAQTLDLDGATLQIAELNFAGQPRTLANGTVAFTSDAPSINVATGASATFATSVSSSQPLHKTGGGLLAFAGNITLADILVSGGSLAFNAPNESYSQTVASISGNINDPATELFVSEAGLSLTRLTGNFVKTGTGTLALSCPESSEQPVLAGRLRIEAGSFAIHGPRAFVFGSVPCPSFESSPLLPSNPIANMDKRGSAATGCAGWTFVNNNRLAGYQRNESYFSGNSATRAPDGIQTAFIGKDGSMSCTFTVPAAGRYALTFQSNSRYSSGTWYANEVLIIKVNGNQVAREVIDNTVWTERTVELGMLSAGSHTLAFVGSGELGTDPCALIDDVRVASTTAPGPVDAAIADEVSITIADGATFVLDFSDTLTVSKLIIAGHVYTSGTFSATTDPDIFSGTGSIRIKATPTLMFLK